MKRILIVDDSNTWRNIITKYFEMKGFEVKNAINGIEAYKAAFTFMPDVIITDIIMPGISGYVLVRMLREKKIFSETPIIALTGVNEKIDRFWADDSGVNFFIPKDSEISKKLDEIYEIIDKLPHARRTGIDDGNMNEMSEMDVLSTVSKLMESLLINKVIELKFLTNFSYLLDFDNFIHNVYSYLKNIIDIQSLVIYVGAQQEGLFLCEAESNIISSTFLNNLITKILEKPTLPPVFKYRGKSEITADYNLDMSKCFKYKNEEFSSFIIIEPTEKFSGFELEKLEYLKISYNLLFSFLNNILKFKSEGETDELTSLYNFKHLMKESEIIISKAKRAKEYFSIIMIDIDDFKKINDKYGHLFGNEVLRTLGELIRKSLREYDLPFRFGGEEFLIILPGHNLEEAYLVGERIRVLTENHLFINDLKVTISGGVAMYNKDTPNFQDIVNNADQALYEAKKKGKNLITIFRHQNY